MRKLALFCLILCSGCGLVSLQKAEEYDETGVPIISSYREAEDWMWNNIEYVGDTEQYGILDYWASPQETLSSRKGDCEDISALFLYIVYMSLGVKGEARVTRIPGMGYHMMAVVGGYSFYGIRGEEYVRTISYDNLQLRYGPHLLGNRRGFDDDYIID